MLMTVTAHAGAESKSQESILAQSLIESISENYVLPADNGATVSRGEFVYTLMEALGLSGTSCSFEDVPEKHFAFGAIAATETMGFTGQNSLFYPDRPITYQNAVEIAVSVLGYSEKADYYGGYPMGYLRVANELRLNSGMTGMHMNPENTLLFIFNTLNSRPLEATGIRHNTVTYNPSDKTLLYMYRGIAYAEGIVSSDEASGLTNPDAATEPDSIKIDGILYRGCTNEELLGKNCAVYYKDDRENTVVCAVAYMNKTVKFDIAGYDAFTNGAVEYHTDDMESERAVLDSTYTVVFNRMASRTLNIDSLIKASQTGFVELTDNNFDGKYDVVTITSYEYAWVSAVDLINMIIMDRVSGQSIDFSDPELCLSIKILSEGMLMPADISAISPGSLIACAISEDAMVCSIVVCYDTVSATVTEVGEAGGRTKLIADGTQYYVNSFVYNFTNSLMGMSGSFCLGINGEIAAVSGAEKEMMYGYIMALKEETFERAVWLLCENGKAEKKILASNVKLEGSPTDSDTVWDTLCDIVNSDIQYRLIRYKLRNNEISHIDTPTPVSQVTSFNELTNPEDSLALYSYSELSFNSGAGFSPVFNISGSTVNFVIPDSSSSTDLSAYRTEPDSYFADDRTYEIAAYDIGRNSMPAATLVVENKTNAGVSAKTPAAVVARIEVVPDSDGDPVKAVTLWQNGTFTRLNVADGCNGDIENIEKGDIVRYITTKGEISSVAVDYDLSANTIAAGVTKRGAILEYFKGKLFSTDSGYCYIFTGDGKITTPVEFSSLRNARISGVQTALVEIGPSGKIEVKNMPVDSVRDYYSSGDKADSIVVRQNYYSSQLNVIYRKLEN